jgi:hypothetical protein
MSQTKGTTTKKAVETKQSVSKKRTLGTVKNSGKAVYAKFNKDVEILYKGEKIDLGENNVLFFTNKAKALEDVDFKVEKGWLSERAEEVQRSILAEESVKYIIEANLE